jgi:hypothetical protein
MKPFRAWDEPSVPSAEAFFLNILKIIMQSLGNGATLRVLCD